MNSKPPSCRGRTHLRASSARRAACEVRCTAIMRLTQSMAVLFGFLGLSLASLPAAAQQRPALTEDPDPIADGMMLLEMGVDHAWDQTFPVSGLEGNLLRAPILGVSFALGPTAELQIDGISLSRLSIKQRFDAPLSDVVSSQGNATTSVDDFVIGAKVRLVSETANGPSIGLRFATRLPNAGNEKGIGLDTMDFFQSVLVGKSIASMRIVGNIGLGILSDPTQGDRQNDVLTYGFSIVHDIKRFAILFDANGWISTRSGPAPPGTDARGTATIGFRYTRGSIRFDAGLYNALTSEDGRTGLTGGLTWTFKNFLQPSEPEPEPPD